MDFVGTGTIALFYGHVASNIGDLAINRGEIALLRKAFPDATIRVVLLNSRQSAYLRRAKASFRSSGSVEFVHFHADDRRAATYALNPGKLLEDCDADKADLVVLASGEHLFDYTDRGNYKNLFWRTLPAFAARQRGRRCMVMPSTFGPFESAEVISLMKALFATGARVAARDSHSARLLTELFPSGAVESALDPAFFLEPAAPPATKEEENASGRLIGLVMRSEELGLRLGKTMPDTDETGADGDEYHGSLAFRFGVSLGEQVVASGSSLRVFVQTAADKALAQSIVDRCADQSGEARIEIVAPASIEEYLHALAAVDSVIAARFHALILALVSDRPCFGIHFEAHGHKIPGLLEMLQEPDLCLDLSRTGPAEAAQAALSGLTAAARSMPSLQARLATLRQHTLEWLTLDWNVEPGAADNGQDLQALQPLFPIAIGLSDEAARTVSAQTRRLAELDARVKAVRGDLRRLEAEAHARKKKLTSAERLQTGNKAAAAKAEESLHALEAAINEKVQHLNADLTVTRTKANRDRRLAMERIEHTESINEELARRVQMLEGSESFRIGYAIVRVATAPIRLLRWLRKRSRTNAAAPGAERPVGEDSPPEENAADAPVIGTDELLKLHDDGGTAAIVKAVSERVGNDPDALAAALIQASRQVLQSDNPDIEYPLVWEALQRHRSDQVLRAMFWAAQKAGKVKQAWNCLNEIQELYGLDPNPSQARWLEKARKGAIMNLALFDEIETAPAKAFVPVNDRICYILHNSLPYSSGGYATRAHGLARGLAAVGIEAVSITRPGYPFDVKPDLKGTTLPPEDVIDGIPYVRLWEPKRGGSALTRYVRGAADAFELRFRHFRPALIMAASAHLSALPALIAARRLGLPFIYEVRGFWEITRLSREPEYAKKPYFHVMKLMEAEIANHADHVFTLTAPMRDELVDRGVPAEKISLLPNSCDPDRFVPRARDAELAARLGIPPEVPVIGYIGTFVQYEGLEHLAMACARLRSRGMVFRLMLVGNEDTSGSSRGRITTDIERIASETGFADWLIMPGRVPHDEVEAYYSLIDIAPFPRKPQPVTEIVSPMKPLEALSMEKAVVVSSVRALTEFISDGETGLIFEKGNIESMADTLERLIVDPDLRLRLGRAARAWVSRERTWLATATTARHEINRVLPTRDVQQPPPARAASAGSREQHRQSSPAVEPGTREEIYQAVRKMYAARDRGRKKASFSPDDWARTRLVFEMLEGARTIVDIGIGQAQLANLLARCPDVDKIYGFDFRNYTMRIDPPANDRYEFRVWDITRPLKDPPGPVDVVVVMEVLEHINVTAMPTVFGRLRGMSSSGAALITVPYQEKEPLYHHDKPHGHQQSFDDAKIESLFGPGVLYTDYKQKWYFIFTHDALRESESLALPAFCERVQKMTLQAQIDVVRRQVPAAG